MTTVADVIQQEASKYGLPPWLVVPLISAESGNDPNAENDGHYGLLQLSPDYPGASGLTPQQLMDPTTNLDIGFAQLAKVYNAEGRPGDSLQAYEDTISHAGWATWQGWQAEPTSYQGNYIRAYNSFHAGGIQPALQPVGGTTPPGVTTGFNPFNPSTWPIIGGPISVAQWFLGVIGYITEHPGYVVLTLLALIIMLASGFHLLSPHAEDGKEQLAAAQPRSESSREAQDGAPPPKLTGRRGGESEGVEGEAEGAADAAAEAPEAVLA